MALVVQSILVNRVLHSNGFAYLWTTRASLTMCHLWSVLNYPQHSEATVLMASVVFPKGSSDTKPLGARDHCITLADLLLCQAIQNKLRYLMHSLNAPGLRSTHKPPFIYFNIVQVSQQTSNQVSELLGQQSEWPT